MTIVHKLLKEYTDKESVKAKKITKEKGVDSVVIEDFLNNAIRYVGENMTPYSMTFEEVLNEDSLMEIIHSYFKRL